MGTEVRRSTKSTEGKTRRAPGSATRSKKAKATDSKPGVRKPSSSALDFCRTEFRDSREVDCPVRRQFVRVRAAGGKTMLREIVAGGGEVRLKLYLTALWWATAEPHEILDVPASAWAQAFGLDRYATAGSKRVLDAVTWLTDHDLLRATRRRGAAPELRLLREDGTGAPYHRPWWEQSTNADGRRVLDETDHYFQIPREAWGFGWMSVLSGPAVMCLCIHLDATWGWDGPGSTPRADPNDPRPATLRWYHFTERDRDERWTVSEDTWRRGNHELVSWGLLDRRARWSSGFRTRRQYFEYQMNLEQFGVSPLDVTPRPVRISMPGGGGAS